jgi:shikimate kinase
MLTKIILLGYMGTGKSSIGKSLAKTFHQNFIDLDTYISEREQLSIPKIFETKGVLYFRKKEKEYLNELLHNKDSFILATGGGTPCYYDNIAQINKHGVSISINTPLNLLVNRLKKNKASRPLISHLDDEDLAEFVAKHLFERNTFYHQAQITVNNAKNIEETVNSIEKALKVSIIAQQKK